ncbi:MAG: succinate--CoA ligase subunit beta [Dichotomicrobium sp.]
MDVHEFRAKELLAERGVTIANGRVAASSDDAEQAARELVCERFVVKAQIHAGDRLAGGGIRFAGSLAEVREAATAMLGRSLVTRQTGPGGEIVRRVYIEEAVTAARTFYVAIAVDRASGEIVALGSSSMVDDSEPTAVRDRGELQRLRIRIADDCAAADFASLAERIAPSGVDNAGLTNLLQCLADTAIELDATLLEINPLAVLPDGRLIAVDVKMTIDDNALFRHPDLAALRQTDENIEGDTTEHKADRRHTNYVTLDGDIGIVVNGAGLSLATIDSLVEAGGRPANFMDIRTTATSLDIAFAFELVLANPAAKAVLLNVHGGGMQPCDTVAEGIGVAMRRSGRTLPLVIRLAGNNANFARDRLKTFGVNFVEGSSIADAARRVVAMAQ